MNSSRHKTKACSIAFSSSRTLPGKSYANKTDIDSSVTPLTVLPVRKR